MSWNFRSKKISKPRLFKEETIEGPELVKSLLPILSLQSFGSILLARSKAVSDSTSKAKIKKLRD